MNVKLFLWFWLMPIMILAGNIQSETIKSLYLLIDQGNCKEIEKILKNNPEVLKVKCYKGNSLVFYAIDQREFAIVDMFLDYGTDPNDIKVIYTRFGEAAKKTKMSITLLFKMVSVCGPDDTSVLGYTKISKIIKKLLDKKANINLGSYYDDRLEQTPLMIAIEHGITPLVKLLLENHADPNYKDDEGMTAIDELLYRRQDYDWTSIYDRPLMLLYLIKYGGHVNPDKLRRDGKTYLETEKNQEVRKILRGDIGNIDEKIKYMEKLRSDDWIRIRKPRRIFGDDGTLPSE